MSSSPLESVVDQGKLSSSLGSGLIKTGVFFSKIAAIIFALMTILGTILLACTALGGSSGLIFTVLGLISIAIGLSGLAVLMIRFIFSMIRKVDTIGHDVVVKQEQDLLRIRELEAENSAFEDRCAHLFEENRKLVDPSYLHGIHAKYVSDLETENTELKNKNSQLKQEFQETKETCTNQVSRLKDLEVENAGLQDQNALLEQSLQAFISENLLLKDENASLSKDFRAYKEKFSLVTLEAWKEDVQYIMNQNLFLKPQYKEKISSLSLEIQRQFLYPKEFRFLVDRIAPRSRFFQHPKYEYNSRNEDQKGRETAVHSRLKTEFLSAVLGVCIYEEVENICTRAAALAQTVPSQEEVYDILVEEFPNLLTAEGLWKEWCYFSYPYLHQYLSINYCKKLFVQLFKQVHVDLFIDGSKCDQDLVRLFSYYSDHIPAALASFSLPPPERGGSVFAFLSRQEILLWSDFEIMTQRYLRDTFTRSTEWTGSIETMLSYNESCIEMAETQRQAALESEQRRLAEGVPSIEEEVSTMEPPDPDSEATWVWRPPSPFERKRP
ncbi:hypothetical protein [Candidatus Chlamydia corallus]|uniref:hypothetical protein n=1 Tax=Candidatus Chlamydia corallus TaxID=2038470 RepID=UPI000C2FC532|nr:hypothetical protein [Candidatus Chlamydia corallus]